MTDLKPIGEALRTILADMPMEPAAEPTPSPASKNEEGQALANEMLDPEVWNDPAAVEAMMEAHAEDFEDPDFAAGFIEAFPPGALPDVVGEFPNASDAQQVEFTEFFSNAIATASHSDYLSDSWQDAFFAGVSQHPTTAGGVGELMRTGDFSTEFLMRATSQVVDIPSPDPGASLILEAVGRNPEAAALSSAAYAGQLLDNLNLPAESVGQVFEAGAITYRQTDPSMAEYAASQIIKEVDARDGKLPPGMDDSMAAIATEYIADIAYAANSPVDIPLDGQDPLRDGIEMPFEAAHDLLYAAGGASPEALADLMVATGQWQDDLMQSYAGDPNLSAAYGRQVGALEAMLSGSIGERLIADGKTSDSQNESAKAGLGIVLDAIESRGASLTGAATSAIKDLVTDILLPSSNEEAKARADYVGQVVADRRDAFRDAANYLLVNPSNLEKYNLGQNPPTTVDISPATTIAEYESALQAQYAAQGYPYIEVNADFTVDDGNGGLQIMPLEQMSAHQRAAYVQWISMPDVQQVLLQQVTTQNQAQDDVPFGMGD